MRANVSCAPRLRQEHGILRHVTDACRARRDQNFDPRPAQGRDAGKIDAVETARELDIAEDKADIGRVVSEIRERVLSAPGLRRRRPEFFKDHSRHAANLRIVGHDQKDQRWRARRAAMVAGPHAKATTAGRGGFSLALTYVYSRGAGSPPWER